MARDAITMTWFSPRCCTHHPRSKCLLRHINLKPYMKILFLFMPRKHGSQLFIITNCHPFIFPIIVFVCHFIKQTPRILATNYLPKLSEIPITSHWQPIIETSLVFLLILCIEHVPVPSNVHQESQPQLHPNRRKTETRSTH